MLMMPHRSTWNADASPELAAPTRPAPLPTILGQMQNPNGCIIKMTLHRVSCNKAYLAPKMDCQAESYIVVLPLRMYGIHLGRSRGGHLSR